MKGLGVICTSIAVSVVGLFASLLVGRMHHDNVVVGRVIDYSIAKTIEDFREQLNVTITNAPVRRNQRRQLIMFITNHETVELSLNALCSLKHVGIDENSYVFVALDEYSYIQLVNANATTIHYPLSAAGHSDHAQDKIFADISRIRPIIGLEGVKMGADVVISNTDIVLFDDPTILFHGTGDFEVQVDSTKDPAIPETNSVYWSLNMGFYKMKASPRVIAFTEAWKERMTNDPTSSDQLVFKKTIKSSNLHFVSPDEFDVDLTNIIESGNTRERMRIRYIDPMLAVNAAGALINDKKLWKDEAERRSIKKPVLCRFFHIGDVHMKKKMMKKTNLWYLNYKGECAKKPPSGSSWKSWNCL